MSYLCWESAERMSSTKQLNDYIYWQMNFKDENQKYQNQLTSKTYEQPCL